MEQAKAIHAERKLAQEQAEVGYGESPFVHREPLNRSRKIDFGREPASTNPLAETAISIYSESRLQNGKTQTASGIFGKNTEFSTPIENYKGDLVYHDK
jgi:hypothetical protein